MYAISAVKALSIASAQGQKIYTIDQSNLNEALSAINLSPESEAEIRAGVQAGKIATAHESQIEYHDWVGEGYIVIDPATGSGAYKIAGGDDGGFLGFAFVFGLIVYSIVSIVATYGLLTYGGLLLLGVALVGVYFWIEGIRSASSHREFSANNAVAALILLGGFFLMGEFALAALGSEALGFLVALEGFGFIISLAGM